MPRLALGIEYDGSSFAGWQWQNGQRSVQACMEAAVSRVANEPVAVVCAGRTDAGVHALEQVAHFETTVYRDKRSWLMGINSNLPEDVRVLWVREVAEQFHARKSAIARFYRYVILNRPTKSALLRHRATWCYYPLNEEPMQLAAAWLIGDQDFSSFRAQGCQSKSPRRIMYFIQVRREDEQVVIELCANAFLHHMVRNIAGLLMEIGAGRQPSDWAKSVLEARDRSQAAITAPPDGLYLGGIFYPVVFGMPKHPLFDLLPAGAQRYIPPADHEIPISLEANTR